jgi:4'-phosphopantetheinyl transferase EntD
MLTPNRLERVLDDLSGGACEAAAAWIASVGTLPLDAAEEGHSRNWRETRRQSFRAGRWCAKRALGRAGYRGGAIGRDKRGAPSVTSPFVLSISHDRDIAAAVAATRCGSLEGIGVDLELASRVPTELWGRLGAPLELALIRDALAGYASPDAILFSSKESAYKALYPIVGRVLDFPDVHLEFFQDRFVGRLAAPESRFEAGFTVRGRFANVGHHVVTFCVSSRLIPAETHAMDCPPSTARVEAGSEDA